MSRPYTRSATLSVVLLLIAGLGLWFWTHLTARGSFPPSAPQQGSSAGEASRIEAPAAKREVREPIATEPARPEQVRIRVTNFTTHEPIAGASLEFTALDEALDGKRSTTDADGTTHCVADALVGARVKIIADGYCPITRIVPDTHGAPVEFELCIAGAIRVHVLNELRSPAAGALVSASLAMKGVASEIREGLAPNWPDFYGLHGDPPATTDETGEKRIEGLPCGLPLVVSASRAVPATTAEVTIDPELRLAEVELVAQAKCCLHGRLVWETGKPVDSSRAGDVTVRCLDPMASLDICPWVWCSDSGEFTLCDLKAGRRNWRVDWPGQYSHCTNVVPGMNEVGDIVICDAAYLGGRVYLSDAPKDFSYQGCGIACYMDGRCVGMLPTLTKEGRFQIRLPVGPVRLDLSVSRNWMASVELEVPSSEISICLDPYVGRLRIQNLELDPREAPYLRLDAVGGEERGRWDGALVAHQYGLGGTESVIGWKDKDLCAWLLQSGTYDVYVGHRKTQLLVCAGRAVIEAGKECVLDASGAGRGSIRGSVRTPEGKPVAGTSIMACPKALVQSLYYLPASAKTDERGEFRLEGRGAATWIVFPASRGPHASEACSVEVVAGRESSVSLILQLPGAVEGVLKRTGVSGEHSSIVVDADTESANLRRPKSQWVKPDEQGHFRVDDLAPGRYWIQAWSGEIQTREHREYGKYFGVRSGETTRCDLDLDFELTALVVTRSGVPELGIDDGYAGGPGGVQRLERIRADELTWGVRLQDGPCLLFFVSKDMPRLEWPPTPQAYSVAYVPHASSRAAELAVNLDGPTLIVRRRREDVILPRAFLTSVGEIRDVAEYFTPANLASIDMDGCRRFPCVPAGSTVELESDRWLNAPVLRQRVTLGAQTEFEVLWPPE